jgi:sugar lactone lactonase YvrE
MTDARLVFDANDVVGESVIWSNEEGSLYWVDIVGRLIHKLDPENGVHQAWPTPDLPTSIGLRERGGFVVGLRRDVALWMPGRSFETLATPEPDLPDNRLNEGAVAPDGSFWVGTMQNNIAEDGSPKEMTTNTGAIYRIAPDGVVTQLTRRDIGISNTMVWTDDGRFITADTVKNTLYQYDYDRSAAKIFGQGKFASGLDRGAPDGSTSDRDGNIYNARVGGGASVACLRRDGSLSSFLDLPCHSPTSCAFGGKDLSTLYVTSARFGMSVSDIAANQHDGGLWALRPGAIGRDPFKFLG